MRALTTTPNPATPAAEVPPCRTAPGARVRSFDAPGLVRVGENVNTGYGSAVCSLWLGWLPLRYSSVCMVSTNVWEKKI